MKNPTAIAKELRERGHKFPQTRMLKDLETFEVTFQHGRYKFYNDIVVEMLDSKYKELYPIKVKAEEPKASVSDLEQIKAMLQSICRELDIKVIA